MFSFLLDILRGLKVGLFGWSAVPVVFWACCILTIMHRAPCFPLFADKTQRGLGGRGSLN